MLDTLVGSSDKDDPAEVAEQGVAAMLAGGATLLAGSTSTTLQGAANRVRPDALEGKAHRNPAEPGSGED